MTSLTRTAYPVVHSENGRPWVYCPSLVLLGAISMPTIAEYYG